jgi:hypothetical protein
VTPGTTACHLLGADGLLGSGPQMAKVQNYMQQYTEHWRQWKQSVEQRQDGDGGAAPPPPPLAGFSSSPSPSSTTDMLRGMTLDANGPPSAMPQGSHSAAAAPPIAAEAPGGVSSAPLDMALAPLLAVECQQDAGEMAPEANPAAPCAMETDGQ